LATAQLQAAICSWV